MFDLLITGAGPVGCVIAERAASELGWSSLVIEKRRHVAGNCFDRPYDNGVLVHQYGPHYFRTHDKKLVEYLSQFTNWIQGDYFVKSFCKGQYFSFPLNIKTFEQILGCALTPEQARAWIETQKKVIKEPKNSEEFVLSRVGRELYEMFYLGYTLKQWDIHPKSLASSVCGRIPIRFNRDERYVDHAFQLTPKLGFTRLFENMLDHPKIKVMLGCNYQEVKNWVRPKIATVYCGPIDEYFDYQEGRLPWRSLRFEWEIRHQTFVQPCVQINYPNDFEYTRSVEIKHVTKQVHPETVLSYEYSQATGDPYYPVPRAENEAMYQKYAERAKKETIEKKVYFSGRLARYRYINTDEALLMGFETFETIKKDHQVWNKKQS
jgi:UDP-galactopyranose mutase